MALDCKASGFEKSASFGWIKQTRASKKAYIQAKPGEGQDKVHCLVNVGLPAGPKQDKVMDAVFAPLVELPAPASDMLAAQVQLTTCPAASKCTTSAAWAPLPV